MLKDLDAVLAAAALTTATLVAPACGDSGTDTETTASSSDPGCPGASTGCPSASGTTSPTTTTSSTTTSAGCPGATTGCPTSAGCPTTTAGCPSATAGCPGTSVGCPGTSVGCPGTSTGCGAPAEIPTNGDELLTWLEDGMYLDWPAESGVHDATNGSPHGRVRVFINGLLDDSLANAQPAHPMGAAAVKELYDGGDNFIGWAVEVKTDADSMGGDGWYWYEIINDSVIVDGNGQGLCTGCHSNGVDFFTTTYPLQ